MKRTLFSLTIGLAFLCMLQPAMIIAPASAQSGESSGASWERLVGDEAETFADVGSAVEAFKSRLAAGDKEGVAKLLGLDPVELMKQADFDDNFAEIAEAAAAGVRVEEVAPTGESSSWARRTGSSRFRWCLRKGHGASTPMTGSTK